MKCCGDRVEGGDSPTAPGKVRKLALVVRVFSKVKQELPGELAGGKRMYTGTKGENGSAVQGEEVLVKAGTLTHMIQPG